MSETLLFSPTASLPDTLAVPNQKPAALSAGQAIHTDLRFDRLITSPKEGAAQRQEARLPERLDTHGPLQRPQNDASSKQENRAAANPKPESGKTVQDNDETAAEDGASLSQEDAASEDAESDQVVPWQALLMQLAQQLQPVKALAVGQEGAIQTQAASEPTGISPELLQAAQRLMDVLQVSESTPLPGGLQGQLDQLRNSFKQFLSQLQAMHAALDSASNISTVQSNVLLVQDMQADVGASAAVEVLPVTSPEATLITLPLTPALQVAPTVSEQGKQQNNTLQQAFQQLALALKGAVEAPTAKNSADNLRHALNALNAVLQPQTLRHSIAPQGGASQVQAADFSQASAAASNAAQSNSVQQAEALAQVTPLTLQLGQSTSNDADSNSYAQPDDSELSVAVASGNHGIKETGASAFAKVMEQAQSSRANPSNLMEQVMAHVKTVTRPGESRIQIQLNPTDLGKLDIQLQVSADGKTRMSLTADNPRTLDMLRNDVRVLERMLTDVGLQPDQGALSFNLRGEGQPGGNPREQRGESSKYSQMSASEEDAVVTERTYAVTEADGLDIRI